MCKLENMSLGCGSRCGHAMRKMADTLLLALLVVLISLVALQQLQLLMMDEYCHYYHQRQLYETQILDSACRNRHKRTRNRRFWLKPGEVHYCGIIFLQVRCWKKIAKRIFECRERIFYIS